MTHLSGRTTRVTFASAVLVAGLALAGVAYGQASTGMGGSPTNPSSSGAGSSNSGTPCEQGCGPRAGSSDMGGSNANRNSTSTGIQPCTPGSTVNMNAGTTCRDSSGKVVTLPNEKGNSAK